MFNNEPLVQSLARELDRSHYERAFERRPRRRCTSDPILIPRYPSTGFIEFEAERIAPTALLRQLRRSPPQTPTDEEDPHPRARRASAASVSSLKSPTSSLVMKAKTGESTPWKDPQPFEVFRAVERKDIMYLMEIRDRAFHLLLRKTGDATPLLHSMRIGQSHKDVSIVLLGAFSRWVNHLEDNQIHLPQTRTLLKSLRTNLKLAIDYGLIKSESDLIASFLQTLIMSEGEKWVEAQAGNVALALRAGTTGRPVEHAQAAVRSFATKQLGKAQMIAALEDYVGNATSDLLMMGAWSSVLDHVKGESIPTYYFARDDRVYKAFIDRLDLHKADIQKTATKRLRWQLRVLRTALEGRSTSYRHKVEMLASVLDVDGQGV